MKPGGDRQHPASVTPHVHVHLWHLSEIQLCDGCREESSEIHVENKVEGQQSSFRYRYIIETLTLIYNLIFLFVGSTREILHDTLFKIIVTLGLKKPRTETTICCH